MQAILRKIDASDAYSFIARTDEAKFLYDKWHFHPELELTYILESTGTRFIGDSIGDFEAGELILIGSYLPHVWKNDAAYYHPGSQARAAAHVIQFLPDFLGDDFMQLREMKDIQELFERAKRGIKVDGADKEAIVKLFAELLNTTDGVQRISLLLQILTCLAHARQITYLSSQAFVETYHRQDTNKINKVYEFTLSSYSRKIMIKEAAGVINMSVPNFCKYFKQRTRKTYNQFLNDVRIGFACRKLIENKESIQQIAFDCGFHNLSNFNRAFKLLKKQTPAEYRRVFGQLET